MSPIRVISDSSCDLPSDIITKYEVDIVPLTIRIGSDEFVDQVELSTEEFWSRCTRSSVLPETAAPSPGAFQSAYDRAKAEGADGVVCVTISSGLSATYQSAMTAAETWGGEMPVRVVDSRFVTIAHGLAVKSAAEAASGGASLDDVVAVAAATVDRTRAYGTLDTLDYLRRGGRIGAAQAMFGSILSIKPVVEIKDGVVTAESKQRTRSKALAHLIETMKAHGTLETIGVTNAIASDVDGFLDTVALTWPDVEIVSGPMGAVLGTHVGPGTISLVARLAG